MEPISTIVSGVVSLPRDNVDTDQIIPARYVAFSDDKMMAEGCFRDWRDADPESPFNQDVTDKRILFSGANFGCGSSRENAVWALYAFGFRAVIAKGFADIFRENAFKNGLLPVEVDPDAHSRIENIVHSRPNVRLAIDLPSQSVSTSDEDMTASFTIPRFRKELLGNGRDDLDLLVADPERRLRYLASDRSHPATRRATGIG